LLTHQALGEKESIALAQNQPAGKFQPVPPPKGDVPKPTSEPRKSAPPDVSALPPPPPLDSSASAPNPPPEEAQLVHPLPHAEITRLEVQGAREIRRLLSQPTDKLKGGIDPGTPLNDALDFIRRTHGITIRIDNVAFKQEGQENVEESQVQLPPSRGIRLGTILQSLLSRLEPVSATYLVQGNHVTIVPFSHGFDPQHLGGRQLLNVEFYERPLDKALQDLADLSGITVLLDPKVGKKAQTPVVATLQNVPLRTAVRLLADMADLKAVTVDNVLYVTTRANAEALEKEETERGAPRPGPVAPITGPPPVGM
jgi:hypothetical protein